MDFFFVGMQRIYFAIFGYSKLLNSRGGGFGQGGGSKWLPGLETPPLVISGQNISGQKIGSGFLKVFRVFMALL